MSSEHIGSFLSVLRDMTRRVDVHEDIDKMVHELVALRERCGRLFVIGVGGGAANAAHAVNDFRKLCDIEAYAPTDGVAELTARTNDDGWDSVFVMWLNGSKMREGDALLVFSVGGGQSDVSGCIQCAVEWGAMQRIRILGVVGRSDGAVVKYGHTVVTCGPLSKEEGHLITPITETMQIAVLHALVSHPDLQVKPTKW